MLVKLKYILLIIPFCLMFQHTFSQSDSSYVSGVVIDASSGNPLSGIKITVPGRFSTYTADSGDFSIEVPDRNAILYVTGPGYQQKQVFIKGQKIIRISLYDQTFNSFSNNVNIPYRTLSKTDAVNAIDIVTAKSTENIASSEGLIKGKIANLNVIGRSGAVGIGSNMYLRGMNSINGTNQPLVIVDGMIFDTQQDGNSFLTGNIYNPLADIDIKDIESISVIKDGHSIYGSKAGNGVIVIKTVHATDEATHINFTASSGINFKPKNIPLMDAANHKSYIAEQLLSKGMSADQIQKLPYLNSNEGSIEYYRFNNNTNWQNEVLQNNYDQNYGLQVTGGDQIARYALSLGYLNSKGIVKTTDYNRYNVRFNSLVNLSAKLKVHADLSFTDGQRNLMNDGIYSRTSPIYLAMSKSPMFTSYHRDRMGIVTPTLEDYDQLNISNPRAIQNNMIGYIENYRFFGNAGMSYLIKKNIKVSSIIGITLDKVHEQVFMPQIGVTPLLNDTSMIFNSVTGNLNYLYSLYSDSWVSYSGPIKSDHIYTAIIGMRYMTSKREADWGKAYNTPSDEVRKLDSGNELLQRTGGSLINTKWASFYSNIDYKFQNKYIASLNLSFDGSSRFGSKAKGIGLENKFGVFPSLGLAWIASAEDFISNYKAIDMLKFRLTFGKSGNDDVGNYGDQKYYTTQRFIGVTGTVLGNIANPYIQWESNYKTNLGADIALYDEKIRITADIFNNKIKDLLVPDLLPQIVGSYAIMSNIGEMSNRGFELNIETRVINSSLKWDVGVGIAHYSNTVDKLPKEIIYPVGNAYTLARKGESVGAFYGFKSNGVYTSDLEAAKSGLKNKLSTGELINFRGGDVIFDDFNKDSIIDENDRQIIGNPNPSFTGMISNTLSWKRFALYTLITFNQGNDVYNMMRHEIESMKGTENQSIATQNRWKIDGQQTTIPRAEYGDPMGNARFSDRWIENGAYLRLQTISLTYDLHIKNDYLQNAMVYITANNILTLTNYLGYDPEFNGTGSSLAQGIDFGLTPQYRSIMAGVKIGF